MRQVGPKTKSFFERLGKLFANRKIVDLDRAAAAVADEVQVVHVSRKMVTRRAVGDVTVSHHSELFEHVERAVDRRAIDHRVALVDAPVDVLGCDVAGRFLEDLENQ